MKKRRLLSMLLTLAMTVSSLPMTMATPLSAAAGSSENLAEGVVVVTDATTTEEDEHGGYLSLGGRLDRYSSLQYVYNFKYGTKYRITFDARQSVPSNGSYMFRVQSKTAGTQEYWAWASVKYADYVANTDLVQDGKIIALGDPIVQNGTNFYWLHSDSVTPKHLEKLAAWHNDFPVGSDMPDESYDVVLAGLQADAVAALLATNPEATEDEQKAAKAQAKTDYDAEIAENPVKYYNDYLIISDNIHMNTLNANGAWVEDISYHFTFCDKPEGSESDTVLDTVAMYAGTDSVYTQAFDIDNFVLEEYDAEADEWTVRASHDFDTAEDIIGSDAGCFKMGNSSDVTTVSANVAPVITVAGDADYFRVSDTTSVEIGFDDNSTIPAGEYELSADIRYAYSTAVAKPADNTDVTATVYSGNDEIASIDTTTVKNVWSELNTSFALTEATALDDLTFVIDAEAACDLDVKSVELVLVEEYGAEETVSSDDLLNGATATYNGVIEHYDAPAAPNGFMTVSPRRWTNTASGAPAEIVKLTLTDDTTTENDNIDTAKTYYVAFNVRLSAKSNNTLSARVYTECTNSETDSTYVTTTENSTIGMMSGSVDGKTPRFIATSEWGYFEGMFTPTTNAGNTHVFKIQRGFGNETQPIDVDNIKVWYMDGETEVVLYENDFTDALQAEHGTLAPFGNGKHSIYHVVEEDYTAISKAGENAVIKYTDIDPEITNGVYELTASIRVPYYYYLKNSTEENHRTATITVKMSDGTKEIFTQEYNSVWGDSVAHSFRVENNATIDSITIDAESGYALIPEDAGVNMLEFKTALTKVKDIPVEPAIPADEEDYVAILANIESELGGDLIDGDAIASFRKGNKYATLSGTKNNWHTYVIDVNDYVDDLLETDKTYYLTVDIRSGVYSTLQPQWRGASSLTDLNTNTDRGNSANYSATDDWTTLRFAYTAGKAFTILPSTSINGNYPVDIDNIKVYAEGEEDSPIYLNDFNDVEVGTVAYGADWLDGCGIHGYSYTKDSTKNTTLNSYPEALKAFQTTTKLEVVQEEPYYELDVITGTDASVDPVYTDGSTELTAGTYAITAKLRDNKFYHNNKTPKLNEIYTLGEDGKTITDTIKGDVPYNIVCTGENGEATEADIYDLSDLTETFTYTNPDNNSWTAANGYNYSSSFSAITYINNNYFNIKAVVATEDGNVESNTVKVDNTWTDCEFVFNVDADTVINSITFVVDSPVEGKSIMSDKVLTLGMKDIDLVAYVDPAVAAVIDAINDLPAADDVTVDDEDAIVAARDAYDALTADQQAQVTNLADLEAAEIALSTAKQNAIDAAAAAEVDALIEAIGTVDSLDDEDAIRAAREAYDALSDNAKEYVEKLDVLTAAEEALDALDPRSDYVLPDDFVVITEENTYVPDESNEFADATATLSGSGTPTAEPGLAGNHYLHVNSTNGTKNGSFGYMLDDSIPAGTDIYIGFDIRAYTSSDTATSSQRVYTNVNGQPIWNVNFPEADRTFANVTGDCTGKYKYENVEYANVELRAYSDTFAKTFAYPSVFQITEQVYAGTYTSVADSTVTKDIPDITGQINPGQNYYTTTYATEGLGLLNYYRGNLDFTHADLIRISNTISAEMLSVSNQWTHTEMVIKGIVSDTTGLRFSMGRGTSQAYNNAFDVDNIVIFYFPENNMANEPVYLGYQDFEGVTNFDDVVSRSWTADKVILTPASCGGTGSNIASWMEAVIVEDAYTFDVPQGNSVTFTWDNLPAGTYALTGNVRHDYSKGTATEGTGATNLNVSFVSGEAALASEDADPIAITTAMTAIPEGVTFTQTADGAAALTLSVESGMSFKYSGLALTAVEEDTTDADAAAVVVGLIDAIDDPVALESEAAIVAARNAYDALENDNQRALVTNYTKLTDAEAALATLKQAAADEAKATEVENLIAAISETVTIADKAAIKSARTAYDALTDAQKDLVDNYATLEAAEAALAALIVPDDGQAASNIEEYTNGTLINAANDASYIEGNTYMTQYGRKNNWDGFYVTLLEDLEEGKEYKFSYKVRPSVAALNSGILGWRVSGTTAVNPADRGALSGNNVWTTVVLPYTYDNISKTLQVLGGNASENQVYPMDIDDIKIYAVGEEDNPIYFEGFDYAVGAFPACADITVRTGYDAKIVERGDDFPLNTLEIQKDEAYYEASGTGSVDVVYNDGYTTLEPGTYTLTATLRNETFGHDGTTFWSTIASGSTEQHGKYLTWYPSDHYVNNMGYQSVDPAAYRGMVMENNNILNVTATIGLENGDVTDATGIAVPNNWVDYYFEFEVTEATTLSDITISAVHTVTGEPVTLAYKDVDLVIGEVDVDALKAAEVDALIEAIGEVTLDSEAAISSARAAYDALTAEQQAKVTKLDTLTAAEAAYKAAVDAAAAQPVIDAIAAIGTVTVDSEAAIVAARAAYNALTDDQKELVTNIDTLTAAEAALVVAKDQAAAQVVYDAIEAIGEVTLEKEAAILSARAAYNNLTDTQKNLVTNYTTLTDAEEALEILKNAPEEGQKVSNAEHKFGGSVVTDGTYASIENGNRYLTMYNTKNNWDVLTVNPPESIDALMEEGKTYYLFFDVRGSVITPDMQTQVAIRDVVASTTTGGININKHDNASGWSTVQSQYTYEASDTFNILCNRYTMHAVYPLDFDNIRIATSADDANPIWIEDFEDIDLGMTNEGLAAYGFGVGTNKTAKQSSVNPTLNSYPEALAAFVSDIKIVVAEDAPYYNVNLVTGTGAITDPSATFENVALEKGTYTIFADLRDTVFYSTNKYPALSEIYNVGDDGKITSSPNGDVPYNIVGDTEADIYDLSDLTEAFTYTAYDTHNGSTYNYTGSFGAVTYINNNYYNVKAVVTTADGLTLESDTVKVTNVWTEAEFNFDIYEATELTSITFVVESPVEGKAVMDGKTLTLGMKDVDVEWTADIADSGFDTAIGLKAVIDEDSVTENDTITAKIYAVAGTYPVDLSSLTFTLNYDTDLLTLDTFTTAIANGAVANAETGKFAWFYNVAGDAETLYVDDDVLVATAEFSIASIDADTSATIAFEADSNTTPLNFTIANDANDPTFAGYIPGTLSDTVAVTDVLPVYDITIVAGANGTVAPTEVLDVVKNTVITVSGNTLTIGETVVTATANDYYEFEAWDVEDGAVITADMTINATFKAKTYAVSATGDDKATVDAAANATYGVDYTFTVTADEKPTVTVQIGTAQAQIVEPTTTEGTTYTYTIDGDTITDVVTIVAASKKYVTVTLTAGANVTLTEEIMVLVEQNTAITPEKLAEINAKLANAEYATGYEYAGVTVDGGTEVKTLEDALAGNLAANVALTVTAKKTAYSITVPAGMTANDGTNNYNAGDVITAYVDSVITLTPAADASKIITGVTYGDNVAIAKNADGTYTVPTAAILANATISTVTIDYRLIDDSTYMALAPNTKILVITDNANDTVYSLDGVSFYYDSRLGGYATIVANDDNNADTVDMVAIAAKLVFAAGTAEEIVHNGDVNRDGNVNSGDAYIVSQMLHAYNNSAISQANFDIYMRLAADNSNGVEVVTATDAAWILIQWIG